MRMSPYHVYIVVSTAVWVRERREMLAEIVKCHAVDTFEVLLYYFLRSAYLISQSTAELSFFLS